MLYPLGIEYTGGRSSSEECEGSQGARCSSMSCLEGCTSESMYTAVLGCLAVEPHVRGMDFFH